MLLISLIFILIILGFFLNPFFPSILESVPKQIPPPSPQTEQYARLSYTSPSASHTSGKTCSFPMHSDPTLTQINPPGQTVGHQAHLHSQITKKKKGSPKKSQSLFKEHKNKQPLVDFINSPFSLEDVMTLFKPMPSCISPLQDLVRIQLFYV